MSVILQVDFPYQGPWGEEMTAAMNDLAQSINQEPGFIWKIWTENKQTQMSGGVYMFASEQEANAYLTKHSARLKAFGVHDVRGEMFTVNTALSRLKQAPLFER